MDRYVVQRPVNVDIGYATFLDLRIFLRWKMIKKDTQQYFRN